MRERSIVRIAALGAAVLATAPLVQGCAGGGGASGAAGASTAPTTSAADLIGTWEVRGTSEPPGTILTVTRGQLALWRDCSVRLGRWIALDRQFVGVVDGTSGRCQEIDTPAWLERTTGWRREADHPVLIDAQDVVTARLVPGTRPTPPRNLADSYADVPTVGPSLRAAFTQAPASLPKGVRSASPAELLGEWEKFGGAATQPDGTSSFVGFRDDRTWAGSDGCNGKGGLWLSDGSGTLSLSGGASTLVACAAQVDDVTQGIEEAARAGFDGERLVLYDRGGNRLVALQPRALVRGSGR